MEYKQEILEILKKDEQWNKKQFIKHFKITEKQFNNILVSILDSEIRKLDFDQNINRYKYLYKVFKYFDLIQDESSKKMVLKKLEKLYSFCNNKIQRAKTGFDESNSNNVVYKIRDIIKVFLLKLNFDIYDILATDKNELNYQFLYELIYNIKNYDYVYEIFRSFSNLMYITNPNGELLLNELINYYIEIVKNNANQYDIIYFEKIIKLFINSKKFEISKPYLKSLINNIQLSIDNLKRENIKKHEIKRISFFLKEIIKALNKKNTNTLEELKFKYGIIDEFSKEVLLEAENSFFINGVRYLDFRNKFTITIDSPKTQMFDDAFIFEHLKNDNYLFGLFVADVDGCLKDNSKLEIDALKRGESIYLPSSCISMFPYEFINKISLKANQHRFTIGYFFVFDKNMNLINFCVKRTLINVNYNLNYFDINKILKNAKNVELYNLLKDMLKASSLIKEKQIFNKQYQTVKQIKRDIIDNEQSNNSNDKKDIFSTFIILMNHYVADYFNHSYIPFPYHVNLSNYDDYIVKNLKDKFNNSDDLEYLFNQLNEVYIPSFYSIENLGHSGLNLNSYSNVGNPLRQYISLITERLVKRHIIDKIDEPLINIDDMNKICEHINNRQKINYEYKQEYIKTLRKKH